MVKSYATPHATSEEAINAIAEYCTKRKYKCKGCRYSIKFIRPDYEGYTDCVFANCPCSWKRVKE